MEFDGQKLSKFISQHEVEIVCTTLVLLPFITFLCIRLLFRLRRPSTKTIAFFHPYSAAGGGGERVLWSAVRALQTRYPKWSYVIYTGDLRTLTSEEIVSRARDRFNIELPQPVKFVPLASRPLLEASKYPVATLVGQTLIGGTLASLEALLRLNPHVLIDTMGVPMTMPLFRALGGSLVSSYVHYPVISTDMLQAVRERRESYNNASRLSNSIVLTYVKLAYYRLFAIAYGLIGRWCHIPMVNSSWTHDHIAQLWAGYPETVYPPCDVKVFKDLRISSEEDPQFRILSVGQFRPEKDHRLQLRAFRLFLDDFEAEQQGTSSSIPSSTRKEPVLVLAGSCRNQGFAEDKDRVAELQAYAGEELGIPPTNVEWAVNIPFTQLQSEIARAIVGLHTMWNEHFGIAIVESMAGGNIMVAHNSGGPAMDIIGGPENDGKNSCGFLARTEEEYADAFREIEGMTLLERAGVRKAARDTVERFSQAKFETAFAEAFEPYLDSI